MAERKPLFMDQSSGFHEEMAQADSATFGGLTLGGNVTMGGNLITGLGPATGPGEAISWGNSGPVVLSGLDVGGNVISNLSPGVAGTDAVNKNQLEAYAQGLDVKDSVRVATTAWLGDGAAYNPTGGTGGTGAFTSTSGTLDIIDGITLVVGNRILVKDQTDEKQNGIYEMTASGTWQRAVDMDEDAEVSAGAFAFVEEGDTQSDNGYVVTSDDPHTLNTTVIQWSQFSGAGQITAGQGLSKTGNQLDVDLYTTPGLQFIGATPNGELAVLASPAGGVQVTVSGVELKLDNTPDTLDVDGDGLKVVGLPSLFKINDVAVGANVTSANLDTLTDGSDAVGLHTHDSEYSPLGHNHDGSYSPIGHTHAHSSLTGITENDHHNRLHTITNALDHQISGETPGYVLTVTSPTTFAWAQAPSASEAQRIENDIAVNEAITSGDPVYWSTTANRVGLSDASVNATAFVMGVAQYTQGTIGLTTPVVSHGTCSGVLTSLSPTVGQNIYLDAGGGLSLTPPAGARVIRVGMAMNANDLWVDIIDYGKKAA